MTEFEQINFDSVQQSEENLIPRRLCKAEILPTSTIEIVFDHTFLVRLGVKTCHWHENSGLLGSDADWLGGCDFLIF
jgi:hypothetical protein